MLAPQMISHIIPGRDQVMKTDIGDVIPVRYLSRLIPDYVHAVGLILEPVPGEHSIERKNVIW